LPFLWGDPGHTYDTIRYNTRCYFNVRSKADMSQLNLPHVKTTKKCKTEKLKSKTNTLLLGPIRVHNPNDISIGSAFFTRLMVVFYRQGAQRKLPLLCDDPDHT